MNSLVNQDQFYMSVALTIAKLHGSYGEIPIGCVVVWRGKIVGISGNRIVELSHPLLHAEWLALSMAFKTTGLLRLPGATLYTTLEPCAMCAGAIVLARMDRVVIGAMDAKRGFGGSVAQILDHPKLNHRISRISRSHQSSSSQVLQDFFRLLRKKKKGDRRDLGNK